jgi:outer membrane protein
MFRYLTKGKVGIPWWIFIFLAISAVSHAAETKIGCVDIQRALNESEAGKEAKKVMESELKKFQVEIGQRQKELQTLKETLQRQGTMLSMKGKTEKEREYQNKLKEYKRWGEDRQNELKRKEVELTKEAIRGLRAVVKKLGEEEKFTLILEKNEAIVLHVSGTIDLTDRVISIFNSTRSTKQ